MTLKPARIRLWANKLLDVIFPPTCIQCKDAGTLLCADCIAELPWIRKPLCQTCGRSLSREAESCVSCRQRPLPLHQARALFYYAPPLTDIIHKMKYNNLFGLGVPLGQIMVRHWPHWQQSIELIVPIPLHRQRYKERGYNQATLLAKELGQQLQIPVSESALTRTRHTPPQVGLNAAERQINMKDAFVGDSQLVKGKFVLLVDDVLTTGSTMAAAAEALSAVGAQGASAYCVARAG